MTSATLKDLKHLVQTAFQQRDEISRDLDIARTEKVLAVSRYESWENGFLFKRLFKGAFAKRKTESETATDKVAELEEQLRLSTIATYIEVEKEQGDLFYRLKDEFAALSECVSIWDVKSHQATDKFHERTVAAVKVGREKVRFTLANCDLILWDEKVPHLQNAKGGNFYLYPGFILYRAAREAFSVIEYHDVKGIASMLSFHEEDGVPPDSTIIGQTWAKCNKDGSRDKRFAHLSIPSDLPRRSWSGRPLRRMRRGRAYLRDAQPFQLSGQPNLSASMLRRDRACLREGDCPLQNLLRDTSILAIQSPFSASKCEVTIRL